MKLKISVSTKEAKELISQLGIEGISVISYISETREEKDFDIEIELEQTPEKFLEQILKSVKEKGKL